MYHRITIAFLCLLISSLIAGCGSPLTVSGKVTHGGKPIEDGSISFESPDGSTPSFGGTITAGTYKIDNVPEATAGKKVVRVVASIKTGKQIPAGSPAPKGTMVDEVKRLPARFNQKSELTADLRPGTPNVVNFALADK
jgi:hypothetical protein